MPPRWTVAVFVASFALASVAYGQTENCEPNPCGAGTACTPTSLAFTCTCNDATQWYNYTANACQDINECMAKPCPVSATCINNSPGYTCICPPGYAWNATNKACADINECKLGTHNCGKATCSNLLGTFQCLCPKGYYFGNNGACLDVDECAVQNPPCPAPARCQNLPGAYKCTCPKAGYTYDSFLKECLNTTSPCVSYPCGKTPNSCTRSNTAPGGYTCTCGNGFVNVFGALGKQGCFRANITSTVALLLDDMQPGACLDIQWNARGDGVPIWQWTYDGNSAQRFYLTPIGDGYYSIQDDVKAFCWGTVEDTTVDGANIILQTCSTTATSQRWGFSKVAGTTDRFTIFMKHAPNQCITVKGWSSSTGVLTELAPCNPTTTLGQRTRFLA